MSTNETSHQAAAVEQSAAGSCPTPTGNPATAAPFFASRTATRSYPVCDRGGYRPPQVVLSPFPPRISSLMSSNASPSSSTDPAALGGVGARAPSRVPQDDDAFCGAGSIGVGARAEVGVPGLNESLPIVPTGGHFVPARPLLSTSCLSRPESVAAHAAASTRSPTGHSPSSAPLASPLHSCPGLACNSKMATSTRKTVGIQPKPLVSNSNSSIAHEEGEPRPPQLGVASSTLPPCPKSPSAVAAACLTATKAASNSEASGTGAEITTTNPVNRTSTSSTLFHRAASFLNKFAGGMQSSSTTVTLPASHVNKPAIESTMLRRRPSLPSTPIISASDPLSLGSGSGHGSTALATHSTPPSTPTEPGPAHAPLQSHSPSLPKPLGSISRIIPLTAVHTHPSSSPPRRSIPPQSRPDSATANSPHMSIASAPFPLTSTRCGALPVTVTQQSPSPSFHHTMSEASQDSHPQQPPKASLRPPSIRSISSTGSKRTPSIKVPAKKRFGWSRRFFRFKGRSPTVANAPLLSPASPLTLSALDPIADGVGSDPPSAMCTRHTIPSSKRQPTEHSPTRAVASCCIASPRLAMGAVLAHPAATSTLSSRPLLTAGPPLRPSTPMVDPELANSPSPLDPSLPGSPTSPTRRRAACRPPLNSPNPTSISRSTSLASTRRLPRLERVHAEDRHDPSALAHRFQLALSATASDILVRNYRKSPRALVVALYSATLLEGVDMAEGDADSGHGEEACLDNEVDGDRKREDAREVLDGSELTKLADNSLRDAGESTSGPSFLKQFQELLAHSVVPPQLLFPPGTTNPFDSPSPTPLCSPPLFRHTAIVHAELGLLTPPESPMTPPPPLGPIRSHPAATSAAPATNGPLSSTSAKPRKDADPNDAYALKVAHMLLTHHLAVACLSVIQSIDRPTLMSVLARPRDRIPKLVLHCPSSGPSHSSSPTHYRRASTNSFTPTAYRALDRAALEVQSAIDRSARVLHARFIECARLRCPPRAKRRSHSSSSAAASAPGPAGTSPMAFLYTAVLRGVRLMAYVAAADRELRWTWAGRDARVRVPGMVPAVDEWVPAAGEAETGDARVVFSVFPGLVLVTDNQQDPLVDPLLVPGDVGYGSRGRARVDSIAASSVASSRTDDESGSDGDNDPLWPPPPTRPTSAASSTGSTATVQSSHASQRGSRPLLHVMLDDDLPRGRILVAEQVFVVPAACTDPSLASCPLPGHYRTSPVVGVETVRRRAPPPAYLVLTVPGSDSALWQSDRGGVEAVAARPTTMPAFPVTTNVLPLACRTPSPTPTHRLSFGSDTTVVIGDWCSDAGVSGPGVEEDVDEPAMSEDGKWVDVAPDCAEMSLPSSSGIGEPAGLAVDSMAPEWPSPARPSMATAMLREALALEWRTMMPRF